MNRTIAVKTIIQEAISLLEASRPAQATNYALQALTITQPELTRLYNMNKTLEAENEALRKILQLTLSK